MVKSVFSTLNTVETVGDIAKLTKDDASEYPNGLLNCGSLKVDKKILEEHRNDSCYQIGVVRSKRDVTKRVL
jgi:hypothetical protein